MSTITRFEEMEAWQTARRLANLVDDMSHKSEVAKELGWAALPAQANFTRACVRWKSRRAEKKLPRVDECKYGK